MPYYKDKEKVKKNHKHTEEKLKLKAFPLYFISVSFVSIDNQLSWFCSFFFFLLHFL